MALNSSSASVMSDETGCKLSVGMTDENSIGRIVVTISCSRAREQEWVMTAISEHSDGFIMKHTPSPLPSKDAVIQPMWWIRKSGVSRVGGELFLCGTVHSSPAYESDTAVLLSGLLPCSLQWLNIDQKDAREGGRTLTLQSYLKSFPVSKFSCTKEVYPMLPLAESVGPIRQS